MVWQLARISADVPRWPSAVMALPPRASTAVRATRGFIVTTTLTACRRLAHCARTIRIRQEADTIVNEAVPPEGPGGFDSAIPAAYRGLAARLQAAEDRVFPLAMVDADRYERAVTLVGLLRPEVDKRAPDLESSDRCGPALLAVARDLASRRALPTADLDLDAVVDAARSQRLRVLLVDIGRDSEATRIEQARAAGLAWAAVSEPAAADLGIAPQQQWVDVHVATGTRLVRQVRMDPTSGRALFQVDLRSPDGQGMAIECADRAEWLETAEELRAALDGTA